MLAYTKPPVLANGLVLKASWAVRGVSSASIGPYEKLIGVQSALHLQHAPHPEVKGLNGILHDASQLMHSMQKGSTIDPVLPTMTAVPLCAAARPVSN